MIERKDLRRHYIKHMFAGRLGNLKLSGIWLNGFSGEGEYKEWYINGQLYRHGFYKNGKRERDFQQWYSNGILDFHRFYRRGKTIRTIT